MELSKKEWPPLGSIGVPLRWLLYTVLGCAALLQASCSTGPRLVWHSFEFDARWESPGIEILDYRYGTSKQPGARPSEYERKQNKVAQQVGINGAMLRGDELYVKWKVKSTGKVYEDTVNLKNRLPDNITFDNIHFIIHGSKLYVYLISPIRNDGCPTDFSDQARTCIKKAMAENGGVVLGCPASKENLCRITKPCPSADLRILSGAGNCSQKITRIYPGEPEPLNF